MSSKIVTNFVSSIFTVASSYTKTINFFFKRVLRHSAMATKLVYQDINAIYEVRFSLGTLQFLSKKVSFLNTFRLLFIMWYPLIQYIFESFHFKLDNKASTTQEVTEC